MVWHGVVCLCLLCVFCDETARELCYSSKHQLIRHDSFTTAHLGDIAQGYGEKIPRTAVRKADSKAPFMDDNLLMAKNEVESERGGKNG